MAGLRTDYSSAFGAASKPFTFPQFNAYVNLTSFKFFNDIHNIISYWKLRAAYGKSGIQPGPFDRYPVLNLQPSGNELTYTNQIVSRNPDLNVEVSSEKEIGADLSFNIGKGNWLQQGISPLLTGKGIPIMPFFNKMCLLPQEQHNCLPMQLHYHLMAGNWH